MVKVEVDLRPELVEWLRAEAAEGDQETVSDALNRELLQARDRNSDHGNERPASVEELRIELKHKEGTIHELRQQLQICRKRKNQLRQGGILRRARWAFLGDQPDG